MEPQASSLVDLTCTTMSAAALDAGLYIMHAEHSTSGCNSCNVHVSGLHILPLPGTLSSLRAYLTYRACCTPHYQGMQAR